MCKFLNITLVPLLTFGKIFNTELDVKDRKLQNLNKNRTIRIILKLQVTANMETKEIGR